MKLDRKLLFAMLAPGAALGLWIVLTGLWLWATLDDAERAAAAGVFDTRGMLLVLMWLAASGAIAWWVHRLHRKHVAAPAQLLEHASVLLNTDAARELQGTGSRVAQGLANVINGLAAQRTELRAEMAHQVAAASRSVEQERGRLAALVAELNQSVVVCNREGRILLYNSRARLAFRALSQAPGLADGAELIGLGRSIYTVFDRRLVTHALDTVQQRLAYGSTDPSTQFVTATPGGQLVRVQMTPVVDSAAGGGTPARAAQTLDGFVLLLDNITREYEEESARDRQLLALTESSRASLANMQAASEMLDLPDLEAEMRERFVGVIRDEVNALSTRVQTFADSALQGLRTRWPLEDMRGSDLVAALAQRIEALLKGPVDAGAVDPALWLRVDSFSLMLALTSLAARLHDERQVERVQLRLARAGARAQLDLVWPEQALSSETVTQWQTEPMAVGSERSPLSVHDVVERHGGEFWFEREGEPAHRSALFRFLLPLSDAREVQPAARPQSRPEYYDFDLFKTSEQARALEERDLSELSYTVFDTETTGLDPSQGDEIIQIGALRIVNGKLLAQEGFEQLVDPQRPIPPASIPIHGITPEQVQGQPTIAQVLPAFHAFAQDTVLVAHNAAFDMRFLELKQAATGVHFDQPVLDTLLLSAVAHPNQESHALEAIAQRLGVQVHSRHTALGDATVTAEVFLKLLALLQAQGIRTLAQAREASQKTYYARLSY
jgi:DNA polymerase III subunit epsilon